MRETIDWIRDATKQALEHSRASGDPLAGWAVLEELRAVMERRSTMALGVLVGVPIGLPVSAIQHEMGAWVAAERAWFGDAIREQFLELAGLLPAQPVANPVSFWTRLLGGRPTEEAQEPLDLQGLSTFAAKAGLALLPFASHDDSRIRRVVVSALAVPGAEETLEERLQVEADSDVVAAILTSLNTLDCVLKAESCRMVWERHPSLREALRLKPDVSSERMRALGRDPVLAEATLRLLADPERRRFA